MPLSSLPRTNLPLVALACSLGTSPEPPDGALRVLFIGNSLTYANDLPRTVADLATSAGLSPCYCTTVGYPDFSLGDHYPLGDALRALRDEDFDFVVMQQGPSALPESREALVYAAGLFGQHIDREGAKAIMYGVWPSLARSFDFPNVRDSYRAAADSIGALFAPAGEAWQEAWRRDPALVLYSSDSFHPSPMGTYLAALVIFQRIYGRSPVGVQVVAIVAGTTQSWSGATVRLLQEAAAAANAAEDQRQSGAESGSGRMAPDDQPDPLRPQTSHISLWPRGLVASGPLDFDPWPLACDPCFMPCRCGLPAKAVCWSLPSRSQPC